MAATHQDTWLCSFCGFSDAVRYLQNPGLRGHEQILAEENRIAGQRRAEENQRRLASMPRITVSDRAAYVWAAYRLPVLAFGGVILFIALIVTVNVISPTRSRPTGSAVPSKPSDVTPIFDAAKLAGKGPKEVEKLLGRPSDSWTPRTGTSNLMQSYALGEEMTVEFQNNNINSFVIFFNQKNVDSDAAYRLVGLDRSRPQPAGISNINIGENWIKVFYSNTVTSSSITNTTNNNQPKNTPRSSRKAMIIAENANLRSTADSYGEIVTTVAYGEEVEIIKQKGPWFQVKYLSQSGWIHGNTIRPLY